MCWKCDHPEAADEDYLAAIGDLKDKHGWALQYVEDDRRPDAYTVGLHGRGLPELVVTGMASQPAARVLNSVATYLMDGGRPVPGERIAMPDGLVLEVVQVEHPDAHLYVAVAFYGSDLRALQLVWANDRGHVPWCPEFSRGAVRQPVFGVRVDPG